MRNFRLPLRLPLLSESSLTKLYLGGTSAVPYALALLSAPLFARCYPVETFGVSAVVAMSAAFLMGFGTLQLHMGIHTQPHARAALSLAVACILIAGGVGLFAALYIVFYTDTTVQLLGIAAIRPWLWTVPILFFFGSINMVLDQWLIRDGQLRQLGRAGILQSALGILPPLCLIAAPHLTNPFIIGQILSQAAGFLYRLRKVNFNATLADGGSLLSGDIVLHTRRNLHLTRNMLPAGIINVCVRQLPVTILGRYFGVEAVGQFARAQTFLNIPVALVGNAFRTTFMNEAGAIARTTGDCRPLFVRTFWQIFAVVAGYYLIFACFGGEIYTLIFGATWTQAGLWAADLSLFFLLSTVASTLGCILYFGTNPRWELLWQIALLLVTSSALWAGVELGTATTLISLYALAYSFLYAVYIAISYRCASSLGPPPTGQTK